MNPLARLLPILVVVAATLPTHSGACVIALGTRGAFAEVESSGARCLTFVDAMGNTYEILSPSPVWKPGMKGLIFAEHAGSGRCTSYPALRICSFQGEAVRTVAVKSQPAPAPAVTTQPAPATPTAKPAPAPKPAATPEPETSSLVPPKTNFGPARPAGQ